MIAGDMVDGSARIYKEDEYTIVQGLKFRDGTERWYPGLDLGSFQDGLSVVKHVWEHSFGVIDRRGEFVLEVNHLAISDYSNGRSFVFNEDLRLVDTKGDELKVFDEVYVTDVYHDGLAIASIIDGETHGNEKIDGYIDRSGNFVIPAIYRNTITSPTIHSEDDWYSEGLIRVRVGDLAGYVDRDNSVVIDPSFADAGRFSFGLARVTLDGVTSYIDRNGNLAFSSLFQQARTFSEGLAAVCTDGSWTFIDLDGKPVMPHTFESAQSFVGGLAVVKANGGYGMIDRTGEFVIPPEFDSLTPFEEGIARAAKNRRPGFIDRSANGVWAKIPPMTEFLVQSN
jgi:hypothetical protein